MSGDVMTGDEQYDYQDKTRQPVEDTVRPGQRVGTPLEASQAEVNPAYYPRDTKPEALHNEAERRGAEYPGGNQLQAARMQSSEEDLDPNDPEVANAPSSGAEQGWGHAGTVRRVDDESNGGGAPEGEMRGEGEAQVTEDEDGEESEQDVEEEPKGNASRDEWVAYAKSQGATDEELSEMGRDEIRDQYGS